MVTAISWAAAAVAAITTDVADNISYIRMTENGGRCVLYLPPDEVLLCKITWEDFYTSKSKHSTMLTY